MMCLIIDFIYHYIVREGTALHVTLAGLLLANKARLLTGFSRVNMSLL